MRSTPNGLEQIMSSILNAFDDKFKKSTESAIIDHFRSHGIDNQTLLTSSKFSDVLVAMAFETGWQNSTMVTLNGTEAEFNVDDYLQRQLGRRYRDLGESVSLIVVYCLIFITGVVGNLCTCLVIIRNKRMHTATNYYLFSLAVSDLLTLLLGTYFNEHMLFKQKFL